MKPLHEMSNQRDIAQQRIRLQKEMGKYQRACIEDAKKVQESWKSVRSLFSLASSSVNYFLTGISLAKLLFHRKR